MIWTIFHTEPASAHKVRGVDLASRAPISAETQERLKAVLTALDAAALLADGARSGNESLSAHDGQELANHQLDIAGIVEVIFLLV